MNIDDLKERVEDAKRLLEIAEEQLAEELNKPKEVKPTNYYSIVFMQGDEAEEPLKILDEKGEEAALEYLKQWDYGRECENCMTFREGEPWGTSDYNFRRGEYVVSYNLRLGYIGLARITTDTKGMQ